MVVFNSYASVPVQRARVLCRTSSVGSSGSTAPQERERHVDNTRSAHSQRVDNTIYEKGLSTATVTVGDILRGGLSQQQQQNASAAVSTSSRQDGTMDITRSLHGWKKWSVNVFGSHLNHDAKSHGRAAHERQWKFLREARMCSRKDPVPLLRASSSSSSDASDTEMDMASKMTQVLSWLYIAKGRVVGDQLEELAGRYAYERIHVIDVSAMESTETIAAGVCWMGASRLPSGPVCIAAYLNRLKHRFTQRYNDGHSIVIVTYDASTSYMTLHSLALFFFMYCGLNQRDSRTLAATLVEKQVPPATIIESGVEELALVGLGWIQRVIVEWPYYAASAVNIAGDIVGGWHVTKRLHRDEAHSRWRLQLWGLPPGNYSFKMIVDGEWCVDLSKPSTVDEWGNSNNTVSVLSCAGALPESRVHGDGMAVSPAMLEEYPESTTTEGDDDDGSSDNEFSLDLNQTASSSHVYSAEERLRLARFGASILSYYKKISHPASS